jgi:acyl-CoA-binding protein
MTLEEQFEAAKAESKNLSEKPSNEVLLQLYSLKLNIVLGKHYKEKQKKLLCRNILIW